MRSCDLIYHGFNRLRMACMPLHTFMGLGCVDMKVRLKPVSNHGKKLIQWMRDNNGSFRAKRMPGGYWFPTPFKLRPEYIVLLGHKGYVTVEKVGADEVISLTQKGWECDLEKCLY